MARLSYVLAAVALVAAVSGAKTTTKAKVKTFRQSCVDIYGQVKPEGVTWLEGVNGCLTLTCAGGVAIGTDLCACTYPDLTVGKTDDVWYSIPTCTTCSCKYGQSTCSTLLNCLLPTSTVVVVSTAYTCAGPNAEVMNPGDMYIADCQSCTCTAAGLTCTGLETCPTEVVVDDTTGECFIGWLAFIGGTSEEYTANGEVYVDGCNSCTCTDGAFFCTYTCEETVTTDVVATETIVDEEDDASLDCDVDIGIVVNGGTFPQACGADCTCVNGELDCPLCPDTTETSEVVVPTETVPEETVVPTETGVSPYVCVAVDGSQVEDGGNYMSDDCTQCTCTTGIFSCAKICDRDCQASNGKVVPHGKTYTTTCSSCKCNDAVLTCTNTCAGKVCKVPNSSVTINPGSSKKLDDCVTCKCTSTVLLQCRDKCDTTVVDCICEGRTLRSGKTRTTACQKCTCNNGKVTCKNIC